MLKQVFSDRAEEFIGQEMGIMTPWFSVHLMKGTKDIKECFYQLGEVIVDNSNNDPRVVDAFIAQCTFKGKYQRLAEILSNYSWKYRAYGLLGLYTTCDPHQVEPMPHITRPLYDEMIEEDKSVFDSLPDLVTIYRGTSLDEYEKQEYGQSWTLSKEKAEFFAYKYNHFHEGTKRVVVSTQLTKNDIFAYTSERDEEECLINESCVGKVELISQGLFKG